METIVTECSQELSAEHVEMARQYETAGDMERAVERWELAEQFAVDGDTRDEIRTQMRRIEQARIAKEQADDEIEEDIEGDDEIDDANAFAVLAARYSERIADRYHEMGTDFRSAVLAVHAGRADDAVSYFEGAVNEHPDEAVVQFEAGRAFRVTKRIEESATAYRRAIALEPEWIGPKIGLADASWQAEDWATAEEVLQDAVDLEPENPNVIMAICQTALLTKEPGYGIEAADSILEEDPGNRNLLLLKGQLLELEERNEEAEECYEMVVQRYWRYDSYEEQLRFDRDSAFLLLGLLLRTGQRLERAAELARALISVSTPETRWAHELTLLEVLYKQGAKADVEELGRQLSRAIPESQLIARLRVAKLLDDQEMFDALHADLSDEQRAAWDEAMSQAGE